LKGTKTNKSEEFEEEDEDSEMYESSDKKPEKINIDMNNLFPVTANFPDDDVTPEYDENTIDTFIYPSNNLNFCFLCF
jgi:hypothetical protein